MVPLLVTLLLLVLVAFPLWTIVAVARLRRRNEQFERQLTELQRRLEPGEAAPVASPPRDSAPVATVGPSLATVPPAMAAPPVLATPSLGTRDPAAPPRLPPAPTPKDPRLPGRPASPEPVLSARPTIDWEQFTGTKLLAWIGGFAAFLGAAFFIKYSFERDLVPPVLRAALAYAFAAGLIGGGLKVPRPRYATTAQTLCATGIVCLYAVTFACSSIYDFPAFTPLRTFLLMALITAAAFLLAVRLGAQVVAVLGMLGGFLTPVLLSTGRDNAFGLFGYIALLDAGLIALALHQRWLFLVPLGAAGTIAMQLGWAAKFLTPAKVPTAMAICLVFCALFAVGSVVATRLRRGGPQLLWPGIALPCVAMLFALGFMGYRSIAAQPGLLFSFVFAADACLLALAWLDDEAAPVHLAGGFIVFALLAVWTGLRLTPALLPWALGLYLAHGAVHTTFPLLLARRRPDAAGGPLAQLFPSLALLLMLIPLLKLDVVSFAYWPVVLLLNLMAIGIAIVGGSILGAGIAFVLTIAATAVWIYRVPAGNVPESSLLVVIAGFAGLFFASGLFLLRRFAPADVPGDSVRDPRLQLPVLSTLMPFVLLVLMTVRLPGANPTGIFAVALLLTLLCLALTRMLAVGWLPLCALAGVAAVEYAWDARHMPRSFGASPLAWHLVYYAVFTLFPLTARARFARMTGPWAVAALAGVVQFPLVTWLVERAAPNDFMGVLPALFAVGPLALAFHVRAQSPADSAARTRQLAWLFGAGLFFITLIFPIQFERQWITLGWALEGAALLWLFRRVPHPGLRATGTVLLVAAFVRLVLNPAVLAYHPRSTFPILNWYLYAYGVVAASLFTGAMLLARDPGRVFGVRPSPVLTALGTVLAFLLLNIEIADFFSEPGTRVLTFQFTGNFARDMTYTIAWALFAFGLLLVSIWKRSRAGRFAALGLLGVTVAKLFLHDLERLGALHRIGALFAVAIVAILASIAYQRFLPASETKGDRPGE